MDVSIQKKKHLKCCRSVCSLIFQPLESVNTSAGPAIFNSLPPSTEIPRNSLVFKLDVVGDITNKLNIFCVCHRKEAPAKFNLKKGFS